MLEVDSDALQVRVFMTKKNYIEAQKECESIGGLVILNTSFKQNEINTDINKAVTKLRSFEQRRLRTTSYWIGGKYTVLKTTYLNEKV